MRSQLRTFGGVIETGKIIRPKIDADLVLQIKAKYPETGRLTDKATVDWALKRFLLFEEIVKE